MSDAWNTAPATARKLFAPEETQEQFIARRDNEIRLWLEHKDKLNTYKELELNIREKVTASCFPHPKKGTQRTSIGTRLQY